MLNLKSLKFSPNDLRLPTTLEKRVDTDDNQGGITTAWVAQTGTLWVDNQVRRSTFMGEGGQFVVEDRQWITMRYNPDIATMMSSGEKWRFNGPFGIWYVQIAIDPHNDFQWWLAVCEAVPT